MKMSFGFLSLLLIIAAIPITVLIVMQTQINQQNAFQQRRQQLQALTPPPQGNCIPRPPCLDTIPKCTLPEPPSGWCPVTPTPEKKLTCSDCLSQQRNYLCTNTTTGTTSCLPNTVQGQPFSCIPCTVPSPTTSIKLSPTPTPPVTPRFTITPTGTPVPTPTVHP